MEKIKPFDNKRIIELKNNINKALQQQKRLCEKYKSVRQYRGLQQNIGLMQEEIERLYEEENS